MNPVLTIDLRECGTNLPFYARRDNTVRMLRDSAWKSEDLDSLLEELEEASDRLTYAVVWRAVTYLAELHHVKLID